MVLLLQQPKLRHHLAQIQGFPQINSNYKPRKLFLWIQQQSTMCMEPKEVFESQNMSFRYFVRWYLAMINRSVFTFSKKKKLQMYRFILSKKKNLRDLVSKSNHQFNRTARKDKCDLGLISSYYTAEPNTHPPLT